MTNYERYLEIHNELMNRLANGEITTEQAKEVNDLAFDKYIVEKVSVEMNPGLKTKINNVIRNVHVSITTCKSLLKDIQNKIDKAKSAGRRDVYEKYQKQHIILAKEFNKYADEYNTLIDSPNRDDATLARLKKIDSITDNLQKKLNDLEKGMDELFRREYNLKD